MPPGGSRQPLAPAAIWWPTTPTLLLFWRVRTGFELVLPAHRLAAGDGTEERFFQRLIHLHFELFHWWVCVCPAVYVRYRGFEHLPRGGLVIVGNHPALIDITCLLARLLKPCASSNPPSAAIPFLAPLPAARAISVTDGGHETCA